MDFTEEEKEVIDEFVAFAKKDRDQPFNFEMVVVKVDDLKKSMLFNFRHGKGASYELLAKALPYLKDKCGLTEKEYKSLEKKARIRHKYDIWHWEYQEERPEVKPEQIVSEGEGYLILVGGMRVDYGFDYYEHVREEFKRTGVYNPGLQ